MEKISAYIMLYHDLQFLDDIIKEVYDYLDEIIIVDGPYCYNIETFEQLNLYYDVNSIPNELINIINKYPKITYEFNIFKDEEEKRKFGYNKCSNNIILLIDTDEFIEIDENKLNQFIKNKNKFVGGFDIYNMNRININYNIKVKKYIMFKKNIISAENHLDYTWLIGCNQKQKIIKYMDIENSLGTIYHQTLNRNKHNSVTKLIFYLCLYYKTNNLNIQILPNYNINNLIKIISVDVLKNIIYHSRLTSIGIPDDNDNNICRKTDDVSIDLSKYKNNHNDAYFNNETLCLKDINMFFLLKTSNHFTNEIHIDFINVKHITIVLYEIKIGEKYNIEKSSYLVENNKIKLKYNINQNENILDYVIQFNCNQTENNDFIYKIKSILCI